MAWSGNQKAIKSVDLSTDIDDMPVNEPTPTVYNISYTTPNAVTGAGTSITPGIQSFSFGPTTGIGLSDNIFKSCPMGHVTQEEDLEYYDGQIWTHCIVCKDRIQITRLPGGISVLEVKHLLGEVMGIAEGVDLDGFNVSEALGRYQALKEKVDEEASQIRQIMKLLDLAEKMLEKKVKT